MHTMAAVAQGARPLSAQLRPATPGFTGSSRVAMRPLRRNAFLVRPRAAASEPEDGTPSELQRGVVLGVLMAKAFGKTDSPVEETESVKPAGVVSAALAALMLVRTHAGCPPAADRAQRGCLGSAPAQPCARIRSQPALLRHAPPLTRASRAPGERAHGRRGSCGQGGPVPVAGAFSHTFPHPTVR